MKFNGINAKTVYGCEPRPGFDEQLLQLPKRKPGYEFNWADENGMETDPNETPVFERKTYQLPIMISGIGKTDFFTKYNALTNFLLNAKEFNLDVDYLARRFKVRFSDITAFDKLNMFTQNGLTVCFFTLVLTDDYPASNFPIV